MLVEVECIPEDMEGLQQTIRIASRRESPARREFDGEERRGPTWHSQQRTGAKLDHPWVEVGPKEGSTWA